MSAAAISVDCCWLVYAGSDPADFMDVVHVMSGFDRHEYHLLFDYEHRILAEYDRHVSSGVGRNFIKSCLRNGRVLYYSGRLTSAQQSALDAAGFDPSDRPYLAVASAHGTAPYLTTEEKHLDTAQAARILAACGVRVIDTAAAMTLLP